MASTLHITNGDSAAAVMRQAGLDGEILPWDVIPTNAGIHRQACDYVCRLLPA